MNNKNPYKCFPNFVLRTPLLSISQYKNLTSKKNISDNDLKNLCSNPMVSEAIFLASPILHNEINKWLKNEIADNRKIAKLKLSILKYISRMSSRCTPFGLFAGCSLGQFGDETFIELKPTNQNKRHTRFDMNYLVALAQDLARNERIKTQLKFYPNSSIYKVGGKLRYVEYNYINGQRNHQIVSVESSEYLDRVLSEAIKGAKPLDLAKLLVDDEINLEEASEFIEELISCQLLISELEPSVSGPEFLKQIYFVLKKLNAIDDILTTLSISNQKIIDFDKRLGNSTQEYIQLSDILKNLNTDFEQKFLFQTDMFLNTEKNVLSKKIIENINKGFVLLNKISRAPKDTLLNQFKEAFYERFEEREIPLSMALDMELGVGYKQNIGSGDVNPLIDDITTFSNQSENIEREIKWSSLHTLFQTKLLSAIKNGAYTLNLVEDDFKEYDDNWDDLPDTISFMIEVVVVDGVRKTKFNGGAGSSAANLLGRFTHGDLGIEAYVRKIIDVEENINKGKILAEIVHLPESRVGNILMRPELREYEIPYLAKSVKNKKNQISIEDIMISMPRKGKILLRSKKYNKEIIPRLTNAHNYSANSLPIYHFLSDIQTQGLRKGVWLDLGPLVENQEFIPRVEYNNIILQEAIWNLKKHHLEPLLPIDNNENRLNKVVMEFRKRFSLPKFALLVDGDNELLINFNNLTSVRMLIDTVKKRPAFTLKEFLHAENGIVKSGELYYTNQVIASFYNEEKLNKRNIINNG